MSDDRLVARVSKVKTLGLMLIAVGFVAIGIWFIISPEEAASRRISDPVMVWGFGWFVILFFGAAAVAIFSQLFRTSPVMEIDERGILWRRWSNHIIPWSAIARTEQRAVYKQKFLCIWLNRPEQYPTRSKLGKFSGLNKGMGFGDLALSMEGTDQSFDRLLDVVGAHLNARDQRVGTGSAPE